MRNLKVVMRLGLAFGLLLVLMLLAVGVAFLGVRSGAEQASRLERENMALLNTANTMRVAQLDEAVAIRDFVSLPDVESQRAANRRLKASEKAYADAAAELDRLQLLVEFFLGFTSDDSNRSFNPILLYVPPKTRRQDREKGDKNDPENCVIAFYSCFISRLLIRR